MGPPLPMYCSKLPVEWIIGNYDKCVCVCVYIYFINNLFWQCYRASQVIYGMNSCRGLACWKANCPVSKPFGCTSQQHRVQRRMLKASEVITYKVITQKGATVRQRWHCTRQNQQLLPLQCSSDFWAKSLPWPFCIYPFSRIQRRDLPTCLVPSETPREHLFLFPICHFTRKHWLLGKKISVSHL